MKVGERISELRKERGLTQKSLANSLNLDRTTIVKWESGKRIPDLEKVIALADFFDVTADYLIGREDD